MNDDLQQQSPVMDNEPAPEEAPPQQQTPRPRSASSADIPTAPEYEDEVPTRPRSNSAPAVLTATLDRMDATLRKAYARGALGVTIPYTRPIRDPDAEGDDSESTGESEEDDPELESEPVVDELTSLRQKVALRKEQMTLEKLERTYQAEKEEQARVEMDHRQKLLDRVRITVTSPMEKVGADMTGSGLNDRDFQQTEDSRLLSSGGGEISEDASDFFELQLAERDDLADRAGFYRGITIDPRQSAVAVRSFRDVLKRYEKKKPSPKPETALTTQPTQLFYLKPTLAGYFDSQFTYSEHLHQSQKNGVIGISFSLAASGGGIGWDAGVGVGYGYGRQEETKQAQAGKTVFVTTSYCLPKIELSFDDRIPCASDAFVAAVHSAVDSEGDRAAALLSVLAAFGHFVSRRVVLGGKLFATTQKTLTGTESASDVATNHHAEVKAQVSTPKVAAETKSTVDVQNRDQASAKAQSEKQKVEFTAVGGEGQFLSDAASWGESLGNYRRWSPITWDGLVPSIRLLPQTLQSSCLAILADYARKRAVRQILEEQSHFLFYTGYQELAGHLAKKVYLRLTSRVSHTHMEKALGVAIRGDITQMADGLAATTEAVDPSDQGQVWHMNALGQVISAVTRKDKEFALTPLLPEDSQADKIDEQALVGAKVVVAERDSRPHQIWKYTGSGHLFNVSLGLVLCTDGKLAKPSANYLASQLWDCIDTDLPVAPLPAAPATPAPAPDAPSEPSGRAAEPSTEIEEAEPEDRALDNGFGCEAREPTVPKTKSKAKQKPAPAIDPPKPPEPPKQIEAPPKPLGPNMPVGEPFMIFVGTPSEDVKTSLCVSILNTQPLTNAQVVCWHAVYGHHQIWYAEANGRIYSKLQEGGRQLYLTRKSGKLVLDVYGTDDTQLWLYRQHPSHYLAFAQDNSVLALATETPKEGDLASKSSGDGFQELVIHPEKNWKPWFAGTTDAAIMAAWAWDRAYIKGRAVRVCVVNETRWDLALENITAWSGDIAPGVYHTVPSGKSVAFLINHWNVDENAGGGATARFDTACTPFALLWTSWKGGNNHVAVNNKTAAVGNPVNYRPDNSPIECLIAIQSGNRPIASFVFKNAT